MWIVNAGIIAAIAWLGALIGYVIYVEAPFYYIVMMAVLLGVLGFSLLLRRKYRIRLVLVLASFGMTFYAVEAFLTVAAGTDLDTRTGYQVAIDLKSGGVDAFRVVGAFSWKLGRPLVVNGEEIYQLSGIANRTTVFCNESGEYMIYDSDEHGFNNPTGIWGKNRLDIVTIGDSFIHGYCVKSEENVASLLRVVHEATLNLGIAGAGPLTELAIVKEYLGDLEPRTILWFYYEGNDLADLTQETTQRDGLRKYLGTDYRQEILMKQNAIDAVLSQFMDGEMAKLERGFQKRRVPAFFTLRRLRAKIAKLNVEPPDCRAINEDALSLFEQILADAKGYIAQWGGNMYLVYLPEWERYVDIESCTEQYFDDKRVQPFDAILSIAQQVGVPMIDITEAFSAHGAPLSLWETRRMPVGHYNAAGYEVVANEVLKSVNLK